MKRSLFALTLIIMLSVLPAVAASSSSAAPAPAPVAGDGISDLPTSVSAWYSQQWRAYPIFTGLCTAALVFTGLYAVSDSFRTRARALWGNVVKVFSLNEAIKCGVCGGKPRPEPKCGVCGGKPKPEASQSSQDDVAQESALDAAQESAPGGVDESSTDQSA